MISFEAYIKEYGGVIISDADVFKNVSIEATAVVDGLCINKSALKSKYAQKQYTMAVFSVADEIATQRAQKNKSAEAVGDRSVHYAVTTTTDKEKALKSKAVHFLRGTGLMYGGMSCV